MPLYQNVTINPSLASPKPVTRVCVTETTEGIKDEKFYIYLTRNYILTKR